MHCGCKIAGHSGTDFKKRESVFFTSYFKKKKTDSSYYVNVSIATPSAQAPVQRHTQTAATWFLPVRSDRNKNLILKSVTASMILVFAAAILLALNTILVKTTQGPSLVELEVSLNKIITDDAVQLHLKEGKLWWNAGELYHAQSSYAYALKLDPHNYEAVLGMANTLKKQCNLHQKYCESAKDYFITAKIIYKSNHQKIDQ